MIYKDTVIQILFSIFLLSSTGIDDMSKSSENEFVTSFATKNNIVSDVNKGQSEPKNSIIHSFSENCPFCLLNDSTERFPTLTRNESSFELYNLTDYKKKVNLKAMRENLRLYAETLIGNNKIYGFRVAQTFIKESVNYAVELHEKLKSLIAICHLYAFFKHYVWPIVSKIRSKLFGTKPTRVLRKRKISFTERVAVLPTTPSEKRIRVQNDIACDEHVKSLKYDSHVISDDESCDSDVNTDEGNNSNCDLSLYNDDTRKQLPCESHVSIDDEATSISDMSCDSIDSEICGIFVEMSPNESSLIDCYFQPIAGPNNWSLTAENLSQDEGGTISTGMTSGQVYDVVCDGDSGATSHSYCHSSVSMEMVSRLSNGCEEDQVIESYDEEYLLDYVEGDSIEQQSAYDMVDLISEDQDEDYDTQGEFSEYGSSLQQSNTESDTEDDNEDKIFHEDIVNITLEQRVKNHAVAAAIFAGTFVLPCCIAAKLLK